MAQAAAEIPFLAIFTPEMGEIVLALREVVRREMPGAVEELFEQSLNYSPDGKYANRICYIWPGKKHATLGFFFGTSLDDPQRMLEGTGKRMRHVKVRSLEQARSQVVADMARQAWAIAPECLAQKTSVKGRRPSGASADRVASPWSRAP